MKDFIKARAKVWCVVKACEDMPVLDGIILETEAEAKAFAKQLD